MQHKKNLPRSASVFDLTAKAKENKEDSNGDKENGEGNKEKKLKKNNPRSALAFDFNKTKEDKTESKNLDPPKITSKPDYDSFNEEISFGEKPMELNETSQDDTTSESFHSDNDFSSG